MTSRVRRLTSGALLAVLPSACTREGAPPEPGSAHETLVRLAAPGPWSSVSGLVAFDGRMWFTNSVRIPDHNSADVYSYDPGTGRTRYERHLFSQDAGRPAVAAGRLWWPFEDPRSSTGRGEAMVTDGSRWRWVHLADAEAFHVHVVAEFEGAVWAGTGSWHAGLQRSRDGGVTWDLLHEHPTPPRRVTRLVDLAPFGDRLVAGLSGQGLDVPLLVLEGDSLAPVPGWPPGERIDALTPFRGALHALRAADGITRIWRWDGARARAIGGPPGPGRPRALAADTAALWVATESREGGALWRTPDGRQWERVRAFAGRTPIDVALVGGRPYVGTRVPGGRGELWGPSPPAPVPPGPSSRPIEPSPPPPLDAAEIERHVRRVREVLAAGDAGRSLYAALRPLARWGDRAAGRALSGMLDSPLPGGEIEIWGGSRRIDRADLARSALAWAIARTGHGEIPVALLVSEWTSPPNPAEKYWDPLPVALWAVSEIGQNDPATIGALIGRLDRPGDPPWLVGDVVGALTTVTGKRFGHDPDAWRGWWNDRRPDGRRDPSSVFRVY